MYWTDRTADVVGQTTGSAQGTISAPTGPITVSYSGDVASDTNINNTYSSWQPASSFTGGNVGNAPPAGDIIAQNGGAGTGVNTITFSQPINDPVMAIWRLGNPGTTTQYVFPTTEIVNIEGGSPSNEYGGNSIYLVTGENAISGDEGNGVIEFLGNYSSITFTIPVSETWYASKFAKAIDQLRIFAPVSSASHIHLSTFLESPMRMTEPFASTYFRESVSVSDDR